jgi:hypothetical protein
MNRSPQSDAVAGWRRIRHACSTCRSSSSTVEQSIANRTEEALQPKHVWSIRVRVLAEIGHSRKRNRPLSKALKRAHTAAMGIRIKIRPRAPLPNRWKWEIFDDDQAKLITASHLSYKSRRDAYKAGEAALATRVGVEKPSS